MERSMPDYAIDEGSTGKKTGKPDPATVIGEMNKAFLVGEIDGSLEVLHRIWFRNILYYMGEQWLDWYDNRGPRGAFGKRYELDMGVPTPVSDIIKDFVRSMKALTLNKKFDTAVWPNSAEMKDKDGAELAKQVLLNMDLQNDGEIEDIKEHIEIWRILTGSGFSRVMPNANTGSYVVGPDGNTVTPRGDVRVECTIPFNVAVAALGDTLRDKRWIGIKSLAYREWVEDEYEIILPEGSGGAGEMQLVDYQRQLMSLVASVSPWKGRGLDGSDISSIKNEDLVVMREMEWRPTRKFPKGRYAMAAGDKVIVNETEMPLKVQKDGEWLYTLTHFAYNYNPGSFWPTGGVDGIISPQNTINRVDQVLEINRESLGRPYVSWPKGSAPRRVSERGISLLAIEYDSRATGGAKPEVNPGTPYPNQILAERDIHRVSAQDATGDPKNILRGQSPHSGASGVLVDILRETAEHGHVPDTARFYRAWARTDRKRLVAAQDTYTEKRLLKIPGRGNEIIVRAFRGSDMMGNTDVRLELSSGAATTNVGKNNLIMDLVKGKFWVQGPEGVPPDVRREVLRRLGLAGFPEDQNLHYDRAEHENRVLVSGTDEEVRGIALPGLEIEGEPGSKPLVLIPKTHDPVFRLDDHVTHLQVHDKLVFSREFGALSEKKRMYVIAHRDMHEEVYMAGVREQMQLQLMMQQGAQGGGAGEGGGGAPVPGAGAGAGMPAEGGAPPGPGGAPTGV